MERSGHTASYEGDYPAVLIDALARRGITLLMVSHPEPFDLAGAWPSSSCEGFSGSLSLSEHLGDDATPLPSPTSFTGACLIDMATKG